MTLPGKKLGDENIRIFNIMLGRSKMTFGRTDRKLTSVFFIQKRSKDKTAVKSGQAKPFHIGRRIDISDKRAITDDSHRIFMTIIFHIDPFS